ncbi:MAG: NAD(+)/NADH kinase [Myxococcota bacterium]
MIVCDERNPRARGMRDALIEELPENWETPEGIAIVIGGDGFLLRMIAEHGVGLAYLGLNAGHVGFLLNDGTEPARVASALVAGQFRAHAFPLLEAELTLASGEVKTVQAVNDVYLERMSGQAARLTLSVNAIVAVEELVADGLIFSTALGSTAYTFSAGGLPAHPALRALQITPICPHQPRLTPFALPPTARASVDVVHHAWRPVRAVTDGRAIDNVVAMQVRLSDRGVHLCYLDDHDFMRQMLTKVLRP